MQPLQVEIIEKTIKLLQDLADLNLISIKQITANNFLNVINELRATAGDYPPSLEENTEEVEAVQAERYASNKG